MRRKCLVPNRYIVHTYSSFTLHAMMMKVLFAALNFIRYEHTLYFYSIIQQ